MGNGGFQQGMGAGGGSREEGIEMKEKGDGEKRERVGGNPSDPLSDIHERSLV